jgi:thioredoxin 1
MKTLARLACGFVILMSSLGVSAAEMPFNQKTFDELRAAGKPVALHVHAEWCSTCRAQARVLPEILAEPKFAGLTVLRVDYDNERDLLKTLKVKYQSTFVVFKGNTEVARASGQTRKDEIAALLSKGL